MSNAEYDIEKLKSSGEIDPESALQNFSETEDYFKSLTKFMKKCDGFLSNYSEYQVITREEVRLAFVKDMKELRDLFTQLGFTQALLDLRYIEKAVLSKDTDTLKLEMREFRTRMAKLSDIIDAAQMESEPVGAEQAETEQSGTDTQSSSAAAAKSQSLILAVDDMPGLLTATAKILKDKYEVMAVTSAQAALKVLEKHSPALFLLDIEMPVMNGYELAAKIREMPRFAQTPILFLTAKSTRDAVISAIKYGGNDYIVKPVDKELLMSKIERFISG